MTTNDDPARSIEVNVENPLFNNGINDPFSVVTSSYTLPLSINQEHGIPVVESIL